MNLVVLANDAFSYLLSWEFMSLASWALVMSRHRDPENRRAGYVYLIMASLGTLALLLALGLLTGPDGNYGFDAIRQGVRSPLTSAAVLVLVLIGAGSKAGLVPLHAWDELPVPDRLHGDLGIAAAQRFRLGMAHLSSDPAQPRPAAMGIEDHGSGGWRPARTCRRPCRRHLRQDFRHRLPRPAAQQRGRRRAGSRQPFAGGHGAARAVLPDHGPRPWLLHRPRGTDYPQARRRRVAAAGYAAMADHRSLRRWRQLLQRPARLPLHHHLRTACGVGHSPLRLA